MNKAIITLLIVSLALLQTKVQSQCSFELNNISVKPFMKSLNITSKYYKNFTDKNIDEIVKLFADDIEHVGFDKISVKGLKNVKEYYLDLFNVHSNISLSAPGCQTIFDSNGSYLCDNLLPVIDLGAHQTFYVRINIKYDTNEPLTTAQIIKIDCKGMISSIEVFQQGVN